MLTARKGTLPYAGSEGPYQPVCCHTRSFINHYVYRIYRMYVDTNISKQCRPRWDAAECGVSSGSSLFATHPAIFRQHLIVNCTYSNIRTRMGKSWGVRTLEGKYGTHSFSKSYFLNFVVFSQLRSIFSTSYVFLVQIIFHSIYIYVYSHVHTVPT